MAFCLLTGSARRALRVSLIEFLNVLVPGVLVPEIVGRAAAETSGCGLLGCRLGVLSGFCGCE